jgi:hypothetical protein
MWTTAAVSGIFCVDFLFRPVYKFLLKHPILALLIIFMMYSYVAYKCLRSAYLADRF